jgi:hypothetical protein
MKEKKEKKEKKEEEKKEDLHLCQRKYVYLSNEQVNVK